MRHDTIGDVQALLKCIGSQAYVVLRCSGDRKLWYAAIQGAPRFAECEGRDTSLEVAINEMVQRAEMELAKCGTHRLPTEAEINGQG